MLAKNDCHCFGLDMCTTTSHKAKTLKTTFVPLGLQYLARCHVQAQKWPLHCHHTRQRAQDPSLPPIQLPNPKPNLHTNSRTRLRPSGLLQGLQKLTTQKNKQKRTSYNSSILCLMGHLGTLSHVLVLWPWPSGGNHKAALCTGCLGKWLRPPYSNSRTRCPKAAAHSLCEPPKLQQIGQKKTHLKLPKQKD